MRAFVVAVLLSVGLVVTGTAPASADTPQVIVFPFQLSDGQHTVLYATGFPAGYSGLVQCSGSVVGAVQEARSRCTLLSVLAAPGIPEEFTGWTATSAFTSYDGSQRIDCRTDPAGCVAGVITVADPSHPESVLASAFSVVYYTNVASGTPRRELADGDTISVSVRYMTPGDWSIAQCRYSLLDPIPIDPDTVCETPTPVTATADRTFTADLVLHEPMRIFGGELSCGSGDCVVALLSPTDLPGPLGRAASQFGISFGPTVMTVFPPGPFADGTQVGLQIRGGPAGEVQARQCALPVGDTLPASRCGAVAATLHIDDSGSSGSGVFFAAASTFEPTAGGATVDCQVDDCVYVAFDADDQAVVQTTTLDFAPPPTLTLTPSTGLLEGAAMTLTVDHLIPNWPYQVRHCAERTCDPGETVTAGADGILHATPTASQRIDVEGLPAYCRADCEIDVGWQLGGGHAGRVAYAMAEGAVAASPSTGLSDGQTVQVTGTDLLPSYAGPPLWIFPTGGWSLTECDAALLDDATLGGVLTHCSAAPVTRGVSVDGSTLDTTIDVQGTITRILGGTTDCTAAPGTCVVGLVRLEQDGSVSTHLAPVAFG
jgi:hypothetical protein